MVKRVSLVATVQNSLMQSLLDGQFSVGDSLPSEGMLAEQYQVSRTTIRDAISALVEKGFLIRKHGKGVFVINKTERVVADSLQNMMLREEYCVEEFMETREVIECQAAYWAASRADATNIETMEKLTDQMNSSTNIKDYAKMDVAFHLELAMASKNRILIAFIKAIKPMLMQMVEMVVLSGGKVESDSKFHFKIIEAIKLGDAELAKKRMAEHLVASEKIFNESIPEGTNLDQIFILHAK